MSRFYFGDRRVGKGAPPFIIAEMSGNHNQSLDRALEIVDVAAKSGAHALKLQTYTADTMTLDVSKKEFYINDPKSLWKNHTLYELYRKAYTPWEWHEPIMRRARELGILCFSSPFDSSSLEFLESLDTPCYKIASFENTDIPLIEKVAATGKPMIISTGMATVSEIDEAVRAARASGCSDLMLLKCTSTYPASAKDTNLLTVPHMRTMFDCEVGISDHTLGIGVAIAAVALGATAIEKHFTLRRADGGVDSAFSMEPDEMKALVAASEQAWQSLGKVSYGPTTQERASLKFRRSLYIAKDVGSGKTLTEDVIRCIRPGYGLPPKFLSIVLGRRLSVAAKAGTPLTWDLID